MNALRFGIFILGSLICASVPATPPEYRTYGRDQRAVYEFDEDKMLRIWMIDVAQGDGLLIQLPSTHRYDPNPEDDDDTHSEHIEILIDGGSDPASKAKNTLTFLNQRIPNERNIEYAVITHHDADHIRGLIEVLNSDSYHVQTIFHNGLASYKPGKREFPEDHRPENAVVKFSDGKLRRGMAFVSDDGTLRESHIIETLDELKAAQSSGELQGIYSDLAKAITDDDVTEFLRTFSGGEFINDTKMTLDRNVDFSTIRFEPIWPQKKLKKYKGWGETINGNSVTFRLEYRNFEMLFTGDHNNLSEAALLNHLDGTGELKKLNCDVLKVPHHGSHHALEKFFNHKSLNPVVSVASMGRKGFRSKEMGRYNWQHPSTEVIQWLGGAHRVYHTHIHERRFLWSNLDTQITLNNMVEPERRHILIETDGIWFRLVEVDPNQSFLNIPSVKQTRRSHGTRWIYASDKPELTPD